jgi:head-tail adaptor
MEPGRFVHRVVIMNFSTTRTSSGQPVEQWLEGKPFQQR